MNLFNIGVNGQYVLGALAAAVVASNLTLPIVNETFININDYSFIKKKK